VFYPDAEYDVTSRISTINGEYSFKTEGKVLVKAYWLEVSEQASFDQELTSSKLSEEDIPRHASLKFELMKTKRGLLHASMRQLSWPPWKGRGSHWMMTNSPRQ
jgi:DNA topoisomerase IA